MGPSWGPIGWADPTLVAHLRFLEDSGFQRSEFEDERLTKAAEALEERAAERQRWRSARPNTTRSTTRTRSSRSTATNAAEERASEAS